MNRSFDIIGKISRYDNWNISLVANVIDEISFNVHKYADGKICPIWDELIDLKIVDVDGFGRFEISVDYTDNTETVKSIHGQSLEVELAQIMLYEFHVNDEDATDGEITDYSKDNYDSEGNFIPTTFYREINPDDTDDMIEFKRKHSLLDRVLADKAPHWSIGYVTPYIALDEESQPQLSSKFQRTYTVDGDTIYDFLTGTVAEESNVVFVFDTINRQINCYSLCDCIDQKTGITFCNGIEEDTTVFVSKNKLANEITISSNKDNVKNCFRIEGGDDIITDIVRAVNMNGSNYIFQFADFQYNDMPEGLRKKITEYQNMMSSKETQDEYYGENGIYTRLCAAYDDLYYYESSMMPNTDKVTEIGTAKEQYEKLFKELNNSTVAVSSMNNYNNNLFTGVTKNIEAYAQIFLDSRFDLEIVSETASYSYTDGAKTGTWEGKIRIKQHTDETNVYPTDISAVSNLKIIVNDDTLEFAKQKIHKALSKGSMLDIDFKVAGMDEAKMKEYFNLYSFNRLTSFYDGYNLCISILTTLGKTTTSDVRDELYDSYKKRLEIVEEIKEIRQYKIWDIEEDINVIKMEQNTFLYGGTINGKKYKPHDFKTYIGEDLYLEFSRYRREDTYKNDNYISDGKSTSECMEIAKKLIEAATKEAKKACVLQRTVSTSLNNLFALPEFEALYDKFALFNYIRIRTEDEILKLRLIGIEFNGESAEEIQVTFSEQIESIDGTVSDLQSIIRQAGNMATSYSSTALQAKKGSEAKLTVSDMFRHGLNAAKTMLKNNDSNEVTITSSGILCKRMDDEGSYGEKQLRITGNIMAFTEDNWQSVRMAIGETMFQNPVTDDKKPEYGIIAENIVGKLIAGDKAFIGNKENNVLITGDGIDIANGSLCIANDTYSIELDPNHRLKQLDNYIQNGISGNIRDDFLFCIRNKKIPINKENSDIIMGIDTSGNGYFKGRIEASGGRIANFNISENKICTDEVEFDDSTGIYFGENGLRIGDGFSVDENGSMLCKDSTVIDSMYIYCSRPPMIGGDNEKIKMIEAMPGSIPEHTELDENYNTITIQAKGLFSPTLIFSPDIAFSSFSEFQSFCLFNDKVQFKKPALFNSVIQTNGIKVTGNLFTYGDLYCGSSFSSAAVHMIIQNNTHKGALAVNDSAFGIWDFNYNAWMIHVNGNGKVTTATTLSDKRLKSDIKDTSVNNALKQILDIKHRAFTIDSNNEHKDIGYIAQELEEINPQMVVKPDNEKDYYHVDSFYLESVITKAIQEFHIDYENKIEKLEQENKNLKQRLEKLENYLIMLS